MEYFNLIKKRSEKVKINLEILRIISCIFVIYMHTGNDGYMLFSNYNINDFRYYLYMFISICSRIAVPSFFMISGIVLLGKDEDIKTILQKRVLKIFLILFSASFLFYIKDVLVHKITFDIMYFFNEFFTSMIVNSYWFLYMYIAFLLLLPMLKAVVKNFTEKEYIYILILSIAYKFLEIIVFMFFKTSLNPYFNINIIFNNIIFMPMMGYYFENVFDKNKLTNKIKNNFILILCAMIFVFVCITEVIFIYQIKNTSTYLTINFFEIFVEYISFCVFLLIKNLSKKINDKSKYAICIISNATFGTYLVHTLFLSKKMFIYKIFSLINESQLKMISVLIYCLLVFVSASIFIIILKVIYLKLFSKIKKLQYKL